MEKLLQKLFEDECKRYNAYLRTYKSIDGQNQYALVMLNRLQQQEELTKSIISLLELSMSNEFQEELEYMTIPNFGVNFSKVEQCKQYYEKYCEYQEKNEKEIKGYQEQIDCLIPFMDLVVEGIKQSQSKLFQIIDLASATGIKFSFSKNNKTATNIFILYYLDNFRFGKNRNVIEIKGCELNKSFVKAYMASTREDKKEAQEWFEKEAKKLKTF